MSIKINLGAWSSVFAVPSKIVDEGLKFSDGVKLKVLLYVLRNSGNELTDSDISSATGVNVTDIPEALDYWVSMGILQKSENEYKPVQAVTDERGAYNSQAEKISYDDSVKEIKQENKEVSVEEISNNVESAKQRFTVTRPQKPDYVFTSQRLAVDEELKILVSEAQTALGKVLSNSDISTLLMLKDTCGLPLDVILMLIQYCISIDKGNVRAIEKIGIGWADEGIDTLEAADDKIRRVKQMNKNFSIVSSAFGLKNAGSPTKKQLDYSEKWVGEWKFSSEMLREAYERCVDSKGAMKFSYIDGILKRWKSNGIRNKKELKSFESSQNKNTGTRKTSYNIDELDKIDTLDDF
ncbi:MAG: DnaD domain protein [Ruminococcus sp.]